MEWMLMPLRRYADFSGRSRRKEYWMFLLFEIIVIFGVILLFGTLGALGDTAENGQSPASIIAGGLMGLLFLAIILGFMVPRLAVTVRRLHDVDKSGWFMFISLVPLIGPIVLLIFLCTEGTKGENRYGPNPKGENIADVFA